MRLCIPDKNTLIFLHNLNCNFIFAENQINMKNIFLALAIIFSSSLVQAQTKVGTIDAEFILQQMPEITQVQEGVKEYNTQLQGDLETTIKKYEDLVAAYQTNSATFPEEEKKAKENEIIGLENEIKNFRQKASVLMQMKNNELTQPLYEKIDKAMREVIAEQGYTQILNSSASGLAYSAEQYDITEAVMKKMGITVKQQ